MEFSRLSIIIVSHIWICRANQLFFNNIFSWKHPHLSKLKLPCIFLCLKCFGKMFPTCQNDLASTLLNKKGAFSIQSIFFISELKLLYRIKILKKSKPKLSILEVSTQNFLNSAIWFFYYWLWAFLFVFFHLDLVMKHILEISKITCVRKKLQDVPLWIQSKGLPDTI